jgi:hypothetical protein
VKGVYTALEMPAPIANLLKELLRDYSFLLLFLLFVAGWFFVKRIPTLIRSTRGASWPTVEGNVETVGVNAFAEQSLGEIGYSYLVEGVRHSGYFSRQFADEQDAWSFVFPLKSQTVIVRYKPSDPGVSVLRLGEQSVLFRAKQGSFPGRLFRLITETFRN